MADRLNPAELVDGLSFSESPGLEQESLLARAKSSLSAPAFREYWKYTSVQDFVRGLEGQSAVRPILKGMDQQGISLTSLADDGLSYPRQTADLDSTARFPLADLALLIAGDLLLITVSQTPEAPIELSWLPGLSVPVVFEIQPGVHLRLIERAEGAGFGNQSLYVHLQEGASVEHAACALTSDVSHWSLTQVHQAADSHYRRQQYQLGGRKRRTETQILLTGRNARAEICGAYVVSANTHLDQQLVIEHRAADTRSRQKFHGIGAGKGSAIFNGRIHIHPGAPGSDAELSNRNLALHADAIINTKPELEIYTDDVKCAHGATIGQISEDSLFYLASRGLGPEAARHMLCRAFLNECIEGMLAESAGPELLSAWSPQQQAV